LTAAETPKEKNGLLQVAGQEKRFRAGIPTTVTQGVGRQPLTGADAMKMAEVPKAEKPEPSRVRSPRQGV
jgi:hypothetical protein